MAPAKRRRETKHRGNPAGMVVARGRTGRKAAPPRRLGAAGGGRQALKAPTWRGAAARGFGAAALLLLFSVLFLHASAGSGALLFVFGGFIYIPATYYFDLWLYRRRVRRTGGKGSDARG